MRRAALPRRLHNYYRAFVWQDGQMIDLLQLTEGNSVTRDLETDSELLADSQPRP